MEESRNQGTKFVAELKQDRHIKQRNQLQMF